MKGSILRRLRLFVLLAWGFAAPSMAATLGTPATTAEAQPPRQVLVMLRMTPPHFRPDGGYGGSYGDGEGRSARWRVARRLAQEQGVSVVDEWPMPILGVDCYVMTVPSDRTPEELAARLGRDPGVSWSEPVHTYRAQGVASTTPPPTHNDPLYRVQPAAREWRLAELHRMSTGRDVRVAVVDSMVDKTQVDLVGQVEMVRNLVTGRPDTPEDHGTGVAGVIAARADNGVGIAGIAPQARIMGLRACWQEPSRLAQGPASTLCDSLSLAKAMEFAIDHKAQIINMSLSGPADLLLGRLLDLALADDIVVVAAYDHALPSGGFPASHRGVVAVAEEEAGAPPAGVLAAPGRDVPTTEPGDRWLLVNGSSFAAAHVSGLFALLRQRMPLAHGASAIVVSYPGDTVDACATLLQKSDSCKCCIRPHESMSLANR